MEFDLTDPFTFVLITLASVGLAVMVGSLWQWFKPEPPPPPPKKKMWTVHFTAPNGFPMSGYSMDEEAAHRVMRMAQYEYDNRSR